jgi:hypothetical protein
MPPSGGGFSVLQLSGESPLPPPAQLALPTCCQQLQGSQDNWCASPSASAVANHFSEALIVAGGDISVARTGKIQVKARWLHASGCSCLRGSSTAQAHADTLAAGPLCLWP